jgi:hypothetical protein
MGDTREYEPYTFAENTLLGLPMVIVVAFFAALLIMWSILPRDDRAKLVVASVLTAYFASVSSSRSCGLG